MKQAILDTDTFSYVIDRRFPEVVSIAQQYLRVFRFFTVSAITVTEILQGLRSSGHDDRAASFLARVEECEVLPVEVEEAILAAEILSGLGKSGQKIGSLDPFIAATAIQSGRPLITNNIRHYQRIVDLGFPLELDNWRGNDH